MKKISAVVLVALFGAAACKDVSAPQGSAALAPPQAGSNDISFRPPPPLDGVIDASIGAFTYTVGVTYFMNGPQNNGWISFNKTQIASVSLSSPSARISIHQGVLSGKGTLTLGANVVDLATGLGKGDFHTACSVGGISSGFTTVATGDFGGGDNAGCGSFTFTTTNGVSGFATINPRFRIVDGGF